MIKSKDVISASRCENCKHFRRHYALDRDYCYFLALDYGHCVYPKLKKRDADIKACQYWERAVIDR